MVLFPSSTRNLLVVSQEKWKREISSRLAESSRYRFPAAPLNARYPQTAISRLRPFWSFPTRGGSHSSFPLSGRWALSPSFSLCVSQCPADDLRTLRRLPLFLLRKARLFALHHSNTKPKLFSLWTTVSLPPLAPSPSVSDVCSGVLSDAHAARTACCRRQSSAWSFNANDSALFHRESELDRFTSNRTMVFKP